MELAYTNHKRRKNSGRDNKTGMAITIVELHCVCVTGQQRRKVLGCKQHTYYISRDTVHNPLPSRALYL